MSLVEIMKAAIVASLEIPKEVTPFPYKSVYYGIYTSMFRK